MSELLSEKSAIDVTLSLLGERHPPYDAIRMILKNAGHKPQVVTRTITRALERWDASFPEVRFLHDSDALAFAIDLASAFPPERQLIERVSLTAAKGGFIGRFPNFPLRFLERNPNEAEVIGLVSAYVANKGSQSTDTEKKLMGLARRYLDKESADREIARIQEFINECEMHIDM